MDLAITVATERREVQSRRDKHGPRQASVSSYPERLGGTIGAHPDTEPLHAPVAPINRSPAVSPIFETATDRHLSRASRKNRRLPSLSSMYSYVTAAVTRGRTGAEGSADSPDQASWRLGCPLARAPRKFLADRSLSRLVNDDWAKDPRGAGRELTQPAPRGLDSLTAVLQGWQERWRHAHLCGLLVGVRDGDQGRLAELSGEEGHADW